MRMRPEIELMLRCARNWTDKEADARITELLADPMDWDFLLRIAERHRMKPFLYWNLKEDYSASVPPSVWEQLETRFRANARANMLALGRMFRLLEVFKEADIPVIAFKGPISTYALYGTPGLREFADLDLLIDSDDIFRTTRLLISQGLQTPMPLDTIQMKALVRFRNELAFSSPDKSLHVDLHWRLLYKCFSPPTVDNEFRGRSTIVIVEDRPVRTLSQSDFFYYLCMRAAIDCWSSIYRLVDLAMIIRRMDQDELIKVSEKIEAAGMLRVMTIGRRLVEELLSVRIPDFLPKVNSFDKTAWRLVNQNTQRLFREPEYQPSLVGSKIIGIRVLERISNKICIILWLPLSPGPSDIGIVRLPERLIELYRVIRFLRATVKYIRGLFIHRKSNRTKGSDF